MCWNLYRDHKSVQRKVSGVKWQQAAVVPGPGARAENWLRLLAASVHTSQRNRNSLRCSAFLALPSKYKYKTQLPGSCSLPWKNRVDQEWERERRKQREEERSCTKTSGLERVAKSERQWFSITDVAEEQCSWHEIIISKSIIHFLFPVGRFVVCSKEE